MTTNEQRYELMCGDCIQHMNVLRAGTARLVVADPPYNQSIDYGRGKKADRQKPEVYLAWCAEWMKSCIRLLTPDGSMWVVISDEWAEHFALMLTHLGLHRRSWIKWYETFGANCTRKFNRCSRHIFHYVVDRKQFVFNRDAVSRPSDRQLKYNDKRANPAGKVLDDIWVVSRIAGTHRERIPGFPTQIPLEITRRIVGCASDPGDLVLDPFSGSASTGVAAIESGRRYIGIEQNKKFCDLSELRLRAVGGCDRREGGAESIEPTNGDHLQVIKETAP